MHLNSDDECECFYASNKSCYGGFDEIGAFCPALIPSKEMSHIKVIYQLPFYISIFITYACFQEVKSFIYG